MDSPASVANKRLTVELNPLESALTENRAVGVTAFPRVPSFAEGGHLVD
jgi:hypothetical protein